jgi:hypothetical protein
MAVSSSSAPVKQRPGHPLGSKNKPKPFASLATKPLDVAAALHNAPPPSSGNIFSFFAFTGAQCREQQRDKDIPSIDTPAAPTAEHIQGPITRARAKQLNYQVLSFLGTLSHIHENMMLPKLDMFVTLRNDGPSMDERDKHWTMIGHGDGSKRLRMEEDAMSGDFRTLKPP